MKKSIKFTSLVLSLFLLFNCCGMFTFALEGGAGNIEITMKDHGYTKDDILNASSEEREKIMEAIYQSIEYTKKPTIQPRWKSDVWDNQYDHVETNVDKCHALFTLSGVLLYWIDSQKFYGTAYYGDDFDTLILNSEKPDLIDIGVLYDCHFYDPDTGKNYRGSANTAKTKTISHYNSAVTYENAGNHQKAMEELGRAIHFLQDANEPHHAANITATDPGSTHGAFEKWVAEHREEFKVAPSYQTNLYDYYRLFSVGDAVDVAARHAKGLSGSANVSEAIQKTNNYADWRYAANECVEDAVQHTAALLYRFALDTHKQ